MYSSSGFKYSELGDIDVLKVGDTYHLFHLVLPNHDYIAHAISDDGFLWKRVNNALFIGEPGNWDDDMLWTMHVSPDPEISGRWRMFYTGISRKELGRMQRIGVAYSNDLYKWEKSSEGSYPLAINSPHYEEALYEGRHWLSCRDPFFFYDGKNKLLLMSARVPYGPIARRGCIGVAREVSSNNFEWMPPLFFPRMYDDIEVPGLYEIGDRYYLIGNIREDIKVHYWHAKSLFGNYESFCDNVLLPKGNYAARIIRNGDNYLIWNFFFNGTDSEGSRLLPPPKKISIAKDGHLELQSFSGFDKKVLQYWNVKSLTPMRRILKNPTARSQVCEKKITLECISGYELFFFTKRSLNFRLKFHIQMQGLGKTGVVCKADSHANGYFISLDLINGFVQIRSWGEKKSSSIEEAFLYHSLQENHFPASPDVAYEVEVICFGGYIEVSIDGRIVLSLVDTLYMSLSDLGIYMESAQITLNDLKLEDLDGPSTEDYGPL